MVNATVLPFVVLAVKLARTETGGRAMLKLLTVTVAGSGVGRAEMRWRDLAQIIEIQLELHTNRSADRFPKPPFPP